MQGELNKLTSSNRAQLANSRDLCVMLAIGAIVLGVALVIWSNNLLLGGGGGSGSGAVTIVRDNRGTLRVDMRLPQSSPVVGRVLFTKSYSSCAGPRFFRDLLEEWRIDWACQGNGSSGTLSDKERAEVTTAARAYLLAYEGYSFRTKPEFLELVRSGDSSKRAFREGAVPAAVARLGGFLCILASIGLAAWAISRARRVRLMDRGCCGECGYDLGGVAGIVCPECGSRNT